MTPEPQSIDAGTDYIVLAKQPPSLSGDSTAEFSGNVWRHVGQYTARSAEAAIRAYMGNGKTEATTVLVAVPVRSWNPVRVETKTVTTLEIKEA